MTDPKDTVGLTAKSDSAVPWLAMAFLAVVVVGGGLFYRSMMSKEGPHAQVWANRGEAMGPFSALLSAGALFAALWAVYLQRREHHDTSQETRRQLAQLERTAQAQEKLANTQRSAAVVVALASMNQSMLQILATNQNLDPEHQAAMRASIDWNGQRIAALAAELG